MHLVHVLSQQIVSVIYFGSFSRLIDVYAIALREESCTLIFFTKKAVLMINYYNQPGSTDWIRYYINMTC